MEQIAIRNLPEGNALRRARAARVITTPARAILTAGLLSEEVPMPVPAGRRCGHDIDSSLNVSAWIARTPGQL